MFTLRPRPVFALIFVLASSACGPSATVLRTRQLIARGDYERADASLTRALAKSPKDGDLLGLRLRLLLGQEKPAAAVKLYKEHRGKTLLRRFAVATIWAAMRHRDPEIRLQGIQAARQTDAPELTREMARRLSDPDARVKSWAAVALSGSPGGAEVLQQQLRASDPRGQAIAVREVGRIAKAKAFDTVVHYIGAKAAVVRAAAASALGYTGQQQAVPLLAKLAEDKDKDVRLAAVIALERLGLSDGSSAARGRIQDEDLAVRLAALTAYATLQKADALVYLREAASGDDLRRALHASRLLAKRGITQPLLNAIAKALVDRRWTVRASGVNTASMTNDSVAWDLAKRGLRDAEPAVRLATVRMLRARKRDTAAADRAARALFSLLCSSKTPSEPMTFARCAEAAELLAERKQQDGRRKLFELTRQGKRWQDRALALRGGLRYAPSSQLALIGLGDAQPRVALLAAIYVYRKLR